MATQTMRKILFPDGTRNLTRERVSVLAYVAKLRGRKPWVNKENSHGIIPALRQELLAVGWEDPDPSYNAIANAMRWLEDHDYAIRVTDTRRKRTTEFGFLDDVDLDLKPLRFQVNVAAIPQEKNGKVEDVKAFTPTKNPIVAEGLAKGLLPIPVPGYVKPPPPHLEAVVELLEQYYDVYPEEYEQWAEAARAALKARLSDS